MHAISFDQNGSIYVLDGGNARVTKWITGSSSATLIAGGHESINVSHQMNNPAGMFMESDVSTIWIADTNNHRIVKWTSPTTSAVVCGSHGSADDQFSYPSGLFIDTTDAPTLYVADTNNHRIQMWLPGSIIGRTLAGITMYYGTGLNQLWFPKTLIVDDHRNMFIVDEYNHRILKWVVGADSGMVIAGDDTYGLRNSQLYQPNSISFDSFGNLYVVDTMNNRIQKFLISCRKYLLYLRNLRLVCLPSTNE